MFVILREIVTYMLTVAFCDDIFMSDEYDNYDPYYYDKEFRDAFPDVYGNDEYAQQFKPVRRSAYKPVRKSTNDSKRSKNEESTYYLIYVFFIFAVIIILLIWL